MSIYSVVVLRVVTLNIGVSSRPLTDFNEITNHFTECIYVHLYNTKLRVRFGALVLQNGCLSYFDVNFYAFVFRNYIVDLICMLQGVMTPQPHVTNSFGGMTTQVTNSIAGNQIKSYQTNLSNQVEELTSRVLC